jgi:hypothetical protein
MGYITASFENTPTGLKQKDDYTKDIARQGYRIISEQLEAGHIKGGNNAALHRSVSPQFSWRVARREKLR